MTNHSHDISLPHPSKVLAPSELSDAEFVQAFEACRISGAAFHHRDHIRLAWCYLGQSSYSVASERMVAGIKCFALHHAGNLAKYHETITQSWMRLVSAAIREKGRGLIFDDFTKASPQLFDVKALGAYYSPERLNSAEGRATWIEPDLQPLP